MDLAESNERRNQDLTVIKGIGDVTERCLRQSLNVRTYEDLAERSIDEIEAAMKEGGRNISRKQIEEWVTQAGQLARGRGSMSTVEEGSEIRAQSEKPSAEPGRRLWKPYASFVVEFQTRDSEEQGLQQRTTVHHLEADKDEQWPDIDGENLCRWILGRVGKEPQRARHEQPSAKVPLGKPDTTAKEQRLVEAGSAAERPVSVEITDVRAVQASGRETLRVIESSGRGLSGVIRSDEPVTFELSFQLVGTGAMDMARSHTPINTEVFAFNRDTAEMRCLTDSEPDATEDNKLSYTTTIRGATLDRGTYRLECVATLQGRPPRQGYLKIPMFQVQ